MSIRLRNINPLGAVYEAAIGRDLAPGEEFDVAEADAGQEAVGDVAGWGLLGQLGANYERVTDSPAPAPVDVPTTPSEG